MITKAQFVASSFLLAIGGIASMSSAQHAIGEGAMRAARSEQRLKAEGVRINPNLPQIETAAETTLRNPLDVARRLLALSIVAERAGRDGDTYEIGQKLLDRYQARDYLTPKERAFMSGKTLSAHERAQFSWRIEAAVPLMWALKISPKLERPSAQVRPADVIELMRSVNAKSNAKLTLRSKAELLDEADLIYRYHWAVVDARINGRPSPMAIDPGIVKERHHALNWLISYMNQEWDNVTTDT